MEIVPKGKTPRKWLEFVNHAWVESASNETSTGEGYWVHLYPEYYNSMLDCGTVHENSLKELSRVWAECVRVREITDTPA
jgi:hypothetical protein